jgi:hypothetical protein
MKKGTIVQLSSIIPFILGIILVIEPFFTASSDNRIRVEDTFTLGTYLFFGLAAFLFIFAVCLIIIGSRLKSQNQRKINLQKMQNQKTPT